MKAEIYNLCTFLFLCSELDNAYKLKFPSLSHTHAKK